MPRNRGRTSLKRRRQSRDPMRDYDRLPVELRRWLAQAVLPWGTRSAMRAFERAMRRTGDVAQALAELDRVQQSLIAKDARQVWGDTHPAVR
jgi:hypothetical protein